MSIDFKPLPQSLQSVSAHLGSPVDWRRTARTRAMPTTQRCGTGDRKEAAETLVASYVTEGGVQDDLAHLIVATCLVRFKTQAHLSALLLHVDLVGGLIKDIRFRNLVLGLSVRSASNVKIHVATQNKVRLHPLQSQPTILTYRRLLRGSTCHPTQIVGFHERTQWQKCFGHRSRPHRSRADRP
jgi:hypothetical protein